MRSRRFPPIGSTAACILHLLHKGPLRGPLFQQSFIKDDGNAMIAQPAVMMDRATTVGSFYGEGKNGR